MLHSEKEHTQKMPSCWSSTSTTRTISYPDHPHSSLLKAPSYSVKMTSCLLPQHSILPSRYFSQLHASSPENYPRTKFTLLLKREYSICAKERQFHRKAW